MLVTLEGVDIKTAEAVVTLGVYTGRFVVVIELFIVVVFRTYVVFVGANVVAEVILNVDAMTAGGVTLVALKPAVFVGTDGAKVVFIVVAVTEGVIVVKF